MGWQQIADRAMSIAESKGVEYSSCISNKTDLWRLALDLGIDRVDLYRIPSEAFTVQRSDGHFTIVLNEDQPRNRHRFSLAHEIAHLLIDNVSANRVYHRTTFNREQDVVGQRVEGLCHEMAAAILMPREKLNTVIERNGSSAKCIPQIAKDFDVSFEAAGRRFLTLLEQPCALLVWRPNQHGRVEVLDRSVGNAALGRWRLSAMRPLKPEATLDASKAYSTDEMVASQEGVLLERGQSKTEPRFVENAMVESIGHGRGEYRRIFSFAYIPVSATITYEPKRSRRGKQLH